MVAYTHNAMAGGRGDYPAALHTGPGPMRNLVLVSLASSFGSCGAPVTPARYGGTLVLLPRFDPAAALRAVQRHRPTHLIGVPTMLRRIAELPEEADASALRTVVAGGAPLHREVRDACLRRFGRPVVDVYGSTGGANRHTGRDPGAWEPGVAGHPASGVAEVSIRDPGGRPVPPGETGEIWALGPMTPMCHVDAPGLDADRRAPGGWVRPGDLGLIDAEGRLRAVDRLRRAVIRGGVDISPAEVERELGAHPAPAEAHRLPVPDPDPGERMCACVVPGPGTPPPAREDLLAFLRDERGLDVRKLLRARGGPAGAAARPHRQGVHGRPLPRRRRGRRRGPRPRHRTQSRRKQGEGVQMTDTATEAPGNAAPSRHLFDDHSEHAFDRHRLLAAAYDPVTTERLAETGAGPGGHCLEVGAKGGGVARWPADRVAPGGRPGGCPPALRGPGASRGPAPGPVRLRAGAGAAGVNDSGEWGVRTA